MLTISKQQPFWLGTWLPQASDAENNWRDLILRVQSFVFKDTLEE